jgi:PBP1b-binding outer membrane lipoprotein LpoB
MKKSVLFALPLIALVFAVSCKKQEAPVAPEQPVATEATPTATDTATQVATPAAAPVATPAAAPVKKGK